MSPKLVRSMHTYGGLGAGLFLLFLSITGVLLTFRGSFSQESPKVPPQLEGKLAVSPWELVDKAEREVGARASRVYFSMSAGEPVRIRLTDEHRTMLYYAPSGELLGRRDRRETSFNGLMFKLHTGAILGRVGELWVAIVGGVLSFLVITGFLLWPTWIGRRRRIKKTQMSRELIRKTI